MDLEDAGTRAEFILHDRDASFTATFDSMFQAAGIRVIRSAVQPPRMNSVMERLIGSCRPELLDQTLVRNHRHLMIVLREYEDSCNTHRPHRTLNQAALLRPLPHGVTDLNQFRVQRATVPEELFMSIAWWHRFPAPTEGGVCGGYQRTSQPGAHGILP